MCAVVVVTRCRQVGTFTLRLANRFQSLPHRIRKVLEHRELLAELPAKDVFEVAFHPGKHIRRNLVPLRLGNKPLCCFTIAEVLVRAVLIV